MTRIVKDPAERRLELVEAAELLFAKKGYEDTAVSDIVKEIKVGQGTFYHYFRSKEDILEAVAEKIVAPLAEEIRNIAEGDLDPATKINAILSSILKANNSDLGIMKLLFQKGNYLLHQKVEDIYRSRVLPPMSGVVSRGSADGVFNAEYPEESIVFLMASVLFLAHHLSSDPEGYERMSAALERITARVLGITDRQFRSEI